MVMEYILTFGKGKYVESYTIDAERVEITSKKEDAVNFLSKSNAEYVAERLGCKAIQKMMDDEEETVEITIEQFYCTVKVGDFIRFSYTNWKGIKSIRKAIIKEFFFGRTEHHKEYQMLIRAFDVDKMEERVFSAKDIDGAEVVHILDYRSGQIARR